MSELPRDIDMTGIIREAIMNQLGITQNQIQQSGFAKDITEKLFCAAILNHGTAFAAKTLANYNKLKDILYEVKK